MQTKLYQSIIAITEAFLPRFTENKVLCITIDARVSYFQKNKNNTAIRGIYIAISRPSNYTKVIMAIDKENVPSFRFDKNADYKFKSDHDSCWRDDGLSTPLFSVALDMINDLKNLGAPALPWKDYSWFVHITDMKIMDGTIKIDRNNDYKVLLGIKP